MEPWLCTIAHVFYQHSAPVYLVGGAVRNAELSLPVDDYDLCGPLLPKEVALLCENTPIKILPKLSSFGTMGLQVTDLQGNTHVAEYTTFRKDLYTNGHRPEKVVFTDSLIEDSHRRDFSINALYRPLFPWGYGTIIDPTGGLADLKSHRLHTT
ncbi:MAG: CCA tRNA nucleotidyltransferase, partial [Clostridiales bacterium]|nr:CCA tRNA nucleotidyltransferase [Clostridiales bacterium]